MNKLVKYFLRIHYFMPFGIRRLYMPIIIILRDIRSFILPLSCYEGEELSSGNHISIVYLGWDKRISSYWVDRFIRQKRRLTVNKIIPIWKAQKYLKDNKDTFDFGIIEINHLTKRIIRLNSEFILPRWLEMRIDIDGSTKIWNRTNITRKIKKHSFTIEKRYSKDDFHFFYERMYKPYINIRYKDSAVIADYKYFLNMFNKKDSQLYFLIKDGQPVAGSIHEVKDNAIRLSGIGVLDGSEEIMQMGVVGALYYFQIDDYYKRNISSVNIGGTSPILTDGLTRFKLSLGGKLAYTKYLGNHFIWLMPLVDSKAVRCILINNPFISISEKDYYCNIFVDLEKENAKEEFLMALEHKKSSETEATRIFCFESIDPIQSWINKDEYLGIEFLKYDF